MDNFKITKTILENINEQNDRINECVDIVNGYTTDEETRVNQEIQRQENELRREEQYNNNENRFTIINEQLETKTTKGDISVSDINKNKGKFDQTYLSDELLQQIAGNTPINSVPADYSITTKKLAFKPIEGVASKNLYNKNDVLKDTHINGNDGTNLPLTGYYTSNFIPVIANEKYTISGSSTGTLRVAFYDSSKNFISKIDGTAIITTVPNTMYLRISISSASYLNTTQLELGEVATNYEDFKIKFTDAVVDDGSFQGKKLKNKSIDEEKLNFIPITGIQSKNLFNKATISTNSFINNLTGEVIAMVGYFASDYIAIDENTTYSISPTEKFTRVAFYDMSKKYLSSATDNSTTITTPTNAVYVRVASNLNLLAATQFEKGSSPTSYVDYKITINPKHLTGGEITPPSPSQQKLLYTLNDAWVSWNAGEKFPIAFFGDSTIDGMGTTGFSGNGLGIDGNGKSPNCFCVKLQGMIREITGNNTMRIYNAGFSGMKADWGLTNIDKEFGATSGYSDVKMVGIGFGINDRLTYKTIKAFREGFKSNIKAMIEWFYEHNIQPFLLTTQALVSSDVETQYITSFPLRTAMHIETVANEVKRELAKEYGLEIIDMHKFTTEFLLYSSYPTKTIIADRTHFGDIGHEYEAGVLLSHITPMVEIVEGYTKIDYSSQRLKKGVPEELLTVPDAPTDSFKLYANYTKSVTNDLKIMDVYVFNTTRKTMTLKAFKNLSDSLTYVKLNGVVKNLSSLESNIGTLDLGMYHLEVYTGLSNKVDFKGFIIE